MDTTQLSQLEKNKAISTRFFDEAFNRFNKSILDELLSPYYVRYDPAMPNGKGTAHDVRNFIDTINCGMPDVNHILTEVIAADDKVITRFSASARHTGELMGIPASGKEISVTGVNIDQIKDGKIVETYVMWDMLGLLKQIGAV